MNTPEEKKGFQLDHSKTRLMGFQFFGPDGKRTFFAENKTEFMNTEPKWTDKDMIEFAKRCYTSTLENGHLVLESTLASFKAGSPSGRDFEIITCRQGESIHDYKKAGCLRDGCTIHSVRRISDSQIFTVGDVVGAKHRANVTIKLFNIVNEKMMVECGDDYCDLYWLTKMVSGEPLFVTLDGKELFNANDRCWWLRVEDWEIGIQPYVHKELSNDKVFKYFSTEQAAKEYVIMNKPVFSLADIMKYYLGDQAFDYHNRMKQQAQQKMNQ